MEQREMMETGLRYAVERLAIDLNSWEQFAEKGNTYAMSRIREGYATVTGYIDGMWWSELISEEEYQALGQEVIRWSNEHLYF